MIDICGLWLHSHEEDTTDTVIYRHPDFPFPPSRGRYGFELTGDGRLREFGPSPTDTPAAAEGNWEMPSPGELHLDGPHGHRRLLIVSAEPGKLIVRKD